MHISYYTENACCVFILISIFLSCAGTIFHNALYIFLKTHTVFFHVFSRAFADKSEVPRSGLNACDFLLVCGVSNNEAEFVSIVADPFVLLGSREFFYLIYIG